MFDKLRQLPRRSSEQLERCEAQEQSQRQKKLQLLEQPRVLEWLPRHQQCRIPASQKSRSQPAWQYRLRQQQKCRLLRQQKSRSLRQWQCRELRPRSPHRRHLPRLHPLHHPGHLLRHPIRRDPE